MIASDLDLREILSFKPKGGVIRFMGRRAVVLDAVALGVLRKELVDTLGLFAARGILTRLGFGYGWRVGEALKEEHPELWAEGRAGPHLPGLAGHFVLDQSKRTDGMGMDPLVQTTWRESYEAEQHLLHFGQADEPVCWMNAGFASGYVSYKEGREVYFIEDRCVARGDPHCRVVGRFRERWGPELEPHLAFYKMESIDAALNHVSSSLRRTERRLRARRQELGILDNDNPDPAGMVARSESMRRTLDQARRFALTDSSILLTGESGVGKELVARFVHAQSSRAGKPFISLNCGAVPETLLESELFGHARGAFTGAQTASIGLFEAANSGTLFLDEIGEVSQSMQVKLLRVLQEKEIRRVGENTSRPVDVRIVSATNRDLHAEVQAGRFRRDLYYRLHVISLAIQPLRERPEDILPLAQFFLRKLGTSMGRPAVGFSPGVADRLLRYPWPGNVRELQSVIEYAVALCNEDQLSLQDLPEDLRNAPLAPRSGTIRTLEDVEREHILAAMKATSGKKSEAAEALGIGLATLYRKLKQYGEAA
jgi:two-component system response regulator HydG